MSEQKTLGTITYSPYAGRVFEGDQTGLDFSSFEYNYPLQAKTIARMTMKTIQDDKAFMASTDGLPDDLVKALAGSVLKESIRVSPPTYTAKHRSNLEKMAQYQSNHEGILAASSNDNMLTNQLFSLQAQYQGSVTENEQSFITLVPLMREVITNPAELYFAEGAFRSLNIPTLQARIPERDAFKAQLQLEPGEEEDFTRVKYGDERFDIKPNVVPLMQFQESRIRATIDPMMIDMGQARTALREARELMAIIEVQGKLNATDGNREDISDYTLNSTSGFPRSANAPHVEFLGIIQNHYHDNRVLLDTIFINAVDMSEYLTNWYRATVNPSEVKGWGIMPFPGIPGLRAVVSPFIARGYAWLVSSKALLKGEGPFMEEMWREPGRRADLGHLVDYVQFLLVTPKRYGVRLDLKTVDGTTLNPKGTVYTSFDQVEEELEDVYSGITAKVRDKTKTLS